MVSKWSTQKKKKVGKHFLDYLGPINFNSLPYVLKRTYFFNMNKKSGYQINKKLLITWLLSEL